MPRILRIVNRLNIGGPTHNVAYLTRYLAPQYETLLLSGQLEPGEQSSAWLLERHGISPRYLPTMQRAINPKNDRAAYKEVRQLIRDFRPQIVHTHAAKAGAIGRLAALHEGVPVTVHTFHGHVFHSYFSPLKTQAFLRVERYLGRRSSAIVAISELQKKELVQDFRIAPEHKFRIIPNGFDLSAFQEETEAKRAQFRQRYHVPAQAVAVGLVGRLTAIKNQRLYIDALVQARQQSGLPLRGFLVGGGELYDELWAYAQQQGLRVGKGESTEEDLTFTDWMKEVDVALAGLDIVALTSNNEGTPVSLVEAGAAARPIVSTDVGGVRDTVLAGESALLAPRGDAPALAQHMAQLATAPQLRAQMGRAGRRFATQRYGYQRLVREMDALYQELLAR